jgi:serine/threonine protein kinase/Tfp pilus assembly protein PilF
MSSQSSSLPAPEKVDGTKTVRLVRPRSASSAARRQAGGVGQGGGGEERSTIRFPGPGDELFGYRLRQEVGRGAFARVFLAEEADLAGRPVVLKISAVEGREPQLLAQLQHTHIVPIYSLHEDRSRGLRAVCMPYFGGATLGQVLQRLWALPAPPTHGSELAAALTAVGGGAAGRAAAADGQAPLSRFRAWDYFRCAAWVVARLAEGLQHAHDRGVFHRDVKPSNVLLGADGQPLLLDFNVSGGPGDPGRALVGGTVAYAAPEHLQALLSTTANEVAQVDGRSDVYALGMVLFEMLAGGRPFRQQGSYSVLPEQLVGMAAERAAARPSVRSQRPDVPWSLDSVVRKCLEPDPGKRYQQAGHLAEDLRRFVDDRPLRYAAEPSRAERLRKWLRRHPRLTSSASVAAVCALLLIGAVLAVVGLRQHLAQAREQLQVEQARDRQRAYETGALRALCLVSTVTEFDDHLPEGARVCEQTLALYDVLGREDWQDQPDWQRLDSEERLRLAENTRELLHLLARARVRLAPGDRAALREALDLLDRAEAIHDLPPSRAVRAARAAYLEGLGEDGAARAAREEAEATPLAGAQDHYLLATTYARQGDRAGLVRAVAELDEALRLNPRHYWALTQRGICYQELGESTLAAADFGTCVGLWPECAWGYFNRGYVLGRAGKKEQARDDFTAAIERDPGFVLAYVNRGLTRLELKESRLALEDFDRAVSLGRDDAFLHAGRGMALEALGRPQEAEVAFAAALARAEALPAPARARLGWSYGFAVAPRQPERAAQAFDAILCDNPTQPQALYGRAMLAVERGDLAEAVAFADRAVAADPAWADARRCRAIVCARRGEFARAQADVNWCLEREPRAGATLYLAACVAARAAAAEQAVEFLQRAFAEGYGREKAETDPDLAGVRQDPRFVRLLSRNDKSD